MNSFEHDRGTLTALHFAKDTLTSREQDILQLAEAMTRRCQNVLDLCTNSRRADTLLHWADARAAITGDDPD